MSTQLRNRVRPSRSFFFTPGSRPERFPAAHTMSGDAIIVDLESTVAPADKGRAREAALTFLREPPIADFNPSRRRFLQGAGILAGAVATFPAWADTFVNLDLPGGPDRRELTTAFPQKAQMILQRTRPPLLETPWDVYDHSVFRPAALRARSPEDR